jgi:hypothetical protein
MGKTFKDGYSKGRNFKNKDKHFAGFKKKKVKHNKPKPNTDYQIDIP